MSRYDNRLRRPVLGLRLWSSFIGYHICSFYLHSLKIIISLQIHFRSSLIRRPTEAEDRSPEEIICGAHLMCHEGK